jgi:hypothetical protein
MINSEGKKPFNAPVSIAIASYLSFLPYNVSKKIQEAQLTLIENNYPGIEAGTNTDFFPTFYRDGDLHFNQYGIAAISRDWFGRAFPQGNLTLRQHNLEMIHLYYQVYLQRDGQLADWQYWADDMANSSKTLAQVRALIKTSKEAFIRSMYATYTYRIPEKAGYDYFSNHYDSLTARGKPTITIRDVIKGTFISVRDQINDGTFVNSDPSLYKIMTPNVDYSPWPNLPVKFLMPLLSQWTYSQTSGYWERK